MSKPRTIIEKLWDSHVVSEQPGAPALLYIDLHLVHEVTSPQAFSGLARARPEGPPAGSDPRNGRPQHSHDAPLASDCGYRSPRRRWRSSKRTAKSSEFPATDSRAISKASFTSSDPSAVSRSRA